MDAATAEKPSKEPAKAPTDTVDTNGVRKRSPNGQLGPPARPPHSGSSETFPKYRPNNRTKTPLRVPWKRRLETFIVLIHTTSLLPFTFLFFFLWCFPALWPFMGLYTVYYLLDRTPTNGNEPRRYSVWLRSRKVYQYLAAYFPITLHKTVDLKPTFTDKLVEGYRYRSAVPVPVPESVLKFVHELLLKFGLDLGLVKKVPGKVVRRTRTGPRYIFGYHPHGIITMGVNSGMATEGAHFSELFPGIRCLVTTLVNQFQLPFYRDYLMALGCTTVTKKNLVRVLEQNYSIVIVVGGALESLYSRPGLNSLVLNRRKGFVKLSLEMCGKSDTPVDSEEDDISLVPIYGFGENNVYDVYYTNDTVEEGEKQREWFVKRLVRRWQLWLKQTCGFTLPIVVSRGIFNYDFGIVPFRRPIDVVYGNPIPVKRLNGCKPGDPVTDEELEYYHGKYVAELERLFAANRDKYLTQWDEDLRIVE